MITCYIHIKDSDGSVLGKDWTDSFSPGAGETVITTTQSGIMILDISDFKYDSNKSEFISTVDLNSPREIARRIEERRTKVIEVTSMMIAMTMTTTSCTEAQAKSKGRRFAKSVKAEIDLYVDFGHRVKVPANGDVDDGILDVIDSANRGTFPWLDEDLADFDMAGKDIATYMKEQLDY